MAGRGLSSEVVSQASLTVPIKYAPLYTFVKAQQSNFFAQFKQTQEKTKVLRI